MKLYPTKLLLCFFLLIMSQVGFAQYGRSYYRPYSSYSKKGKIGLQRYYLGYGITSMKIDIQERYYSLTPEYADSSYMANNPTIDTSFKMSRKSVGSYCYTAGTFYPIIKSGKNGMLALDVSTMVNLYMWEVGEVKLPSNSSITELSISEIAHFPLALVYKSGGDVNRNKKDKVMFSIGCGIAPYMAISKIYSPDLQFGSRKFVMAELGYFAGIAWKIRATYLTGSATLVNTTDQDFSYISKGSIQGYTELESKVKGLGCFSLSLLVMPFSWHWGESENINEDFDF